ncbi:MAG: glucuronate isomerase [Fusobacterium periodonticum]|nr:glucuronate isomerase [Fusobacterium periodonticum]
MDKKYLECLEILELKVGFTLEELKKKWLELSKKYHPDKHATADEILKKLAEEQYKRINEAYTYLKENYGRNQNQYQYQYSSENKPKEERKSRMETDPIFYLENCNELNEEKALSKTIIYSLNANDNAVIGTLLGCFQGDGIKGKIQHGSAWWFNDHKLGMEAQIKSLANLGMLSTFVGMLTDSRSFLSYTRHEYFRRILCNVIGEWVENGELPNDTEFLGEIVSDISYNNAKNYFNM